MPFRRSWFVLFALLLCASLLSEVGRLIVRPAPRDAAAAAGLLQLDFEENQGQTDPAVRYVSRGPGYGLFLTPQEVVFSLGSTGAKEARRPSVARLRFPGANPAPEVVAEHRSERTANYLVGRDRSKWRTGVPAFRQVRYRELYPGVDLLLYGLGRDLEYDFIIAPGAAVEPVRLQFQGAARVQVTPEGGLEIALVGGGTLRQKAPRCYQPAEGGERPVNGQYHVLGSGKGDAPIVGFEVEQYDPRLPLIIDPVLFFSSYLGGAGADQALGLQMSSEWVTLTGQTASLDFPTTTSAFQRNRRGTTDAFAARISLASGAVTYSTYLGGSGDDALVATVNGYFVGYTSSGDLPTTPDAAQPSSGGGVDAFLAILGESGTTLSYCTFLGGSGDDRATAVARPTGFGNQDLVVVGETRSADFPLKNATQTVLKGASDAFVASYVPFSKALKLSTYLGGTGDDRITSVTAGISSGLVAVAGVTTSADFPQAMGQPAGGEDAFAAVLSSTTLWPNSAGYVGGSGNDRAYGIAAGTNSVLFMVGETESADLGTIGTAQTELRGPRDAFVARLDSGIFRHGLTYLGGSGLDTATSVVVTPDNVVHVAGYTTSPDLPVTGSPGADLVQSSPGGGEDAFYCQYQDLPSAPSQLTYLGGSNDDRAYALGISDWTWVVLAGATLSTDLPQPVTAAASDLVQPEAHGGGDAFLSAFDFNHLRPPTNLQAVSTPGFHLRLTWQDNSDNEQFYRIERKLTANGAWLASAVVGANVTEYVDDEATTSAYYRVRATNPQGVSDYTNEATGGGMPPIPETPSDLAVTGTTQETVSLSWQDHSSYEDGFRLERDPGTGVITTTTVGANHTSTTLTDLAPNQTYTFRLFAYNGSGVSPASNIATATTPAWPTLTGPAGLTVNTVATTSLTVSWNDQDTAEDGFDLEWQRQGSAAVGSRRLGSNATSATVNPLSSNSLYTIRVRSYNQGGNSPWSATATGTTLPQPPDTPTVESVSAHQIVIRWFDSTGTQLPAIVERRLRDTPGSFAAIAETAANALSYADTTVTPNTWYEYRVRRRNAGGVSAPTAAVAAFSAGGKFSVTGSLNFGKVNIRHYASRSVKVKNKSKTDPLWVKADAGGLYYSLTSAETTILPPLGEMTVVVQFYPVQPGKYNGTLGFQTSDAHKPTAKVKIKGIGRG